MLVQNQMLAKEVSDRAAAEKSALAAQEKEKEQRQRAEAGEKTRQKHLYDATLLGS